MSVVCNDYCLSKYSYLIRFVYLEKGPGGVAGSVKLDKRVQFPVNELDVNPYLSGTYFAVDSVLEILNHFKP